MDRAHPVQFEHADYYGGGIYSVYAKIKRLREPEYADISHQLGNPDAGGHPEIARYFAILHGVERERVKIGEEWYTLRQGERAPEPIIDGDDRTTSEHLLGYIIRLNPFLIEGEHFRDAFEDYTLEGEEIPYTDPYALPEESTGGGYVELGIKPLDPLEDDEPFPGGEVYLRLYLHYRYMPELGAQDWAAIESQKKVRRLMDEFGLDDTPSPYIERKMAIATHYHADYRRFDNKFPYEGGTWEQPADWLRPVRCVMRAHADAEREKQVEKTGKTPSASGTEDSEIMYVE